MAGGFSFSIYLGRLIVRPTHVSSYGLSLRGAIDRLTPLPSPSSQLKVSLGRRLWCASAQRKVASYTAPSL